MSHPPTVSSDAGPVRRVGVVVVAAGSGSRLGAAVPKAFVSLAGRRIVDRAVAGVLAVPGVYRVAVVVPAAEVAALSAELSGWVERDDEPRVEDGDGRRVEGGATSRVRVVEGGAERTDSVAAGFAALGPDVDLVLVHDAARCLAPVALFERVLAALVAGADAVVPGLPVVDTIKVVDGNGHVVSTPDRELLRAVQTPQGFTRAALERAHASGRRASDDAALAEACGIPVQVVAGEPRAFKVTTPDDLVRAERELAGEA